MAPFRLTDELNGTHSGSLAFAGPEPSPLALHFIAEPIAIPDAVAAGEIEPALTETTVLIEEGPVTEGPTVPWWGALLAVLAILMLMLAIPIIYRARRQ